MLIRRLSLFTIIATFCLILLGGYVHNTESSLACPDWPLCYGQIFPKMEGGVLIEHSHRLLASLIGFLTILLTTFSFKKRNKSSAWQEVFNLSWIALVMVILQGVLGGITVIYKLPTIVSTTHLALSMIFFCTLILIHHKVSLIINPWVIDGLKEEKEKFKGLWNPRFRDLVLFTGVLFYLQMLLGAFLRHSGAGAACGLGVESALFCTDISTWTSTLWPSLAEAKLHMSHRVFASLIGILAIFVAVKGFFTFRNRAFGGIGRFSLFLLGAILMTVILQINLGIATVAMNMSSIPTTAHLGGAALGLALFWKLNLILKSVETELYQEGYHSFLQDLIELTKPKLAGLVMVTVLIGMLIAPAHIGLFKGAFAFILITFTVAGGCALNCYLEIDVDRKMDRTKDRSLPAGRLSKNTALVFGIGLTASSLLGLFFWINTTTAILALLSVVLYLFAYTPMKQKSELAVYIGAIPGAIPPLMGWSVVMGDIGILAWCLFGVLVIWQVPHFLAISIYHDEDYGRANIKVYPNALGVKKTQWHMLWQTGLLLLASYAPVYFRVIDGPYSYVSLALGFPFLMFAAWGIILPRTSNILKLWARRYFYASIIYLPILLGSMLFLNL